MPMPNVSFQNQSYDLDQWPASAPTMVPANPRGLAIYPDNNSKWRGYAYYRNGNANQVGRKRSRGGRHGVRRLYTVRLNAGGETTVAAAPRLSKSSTRNPAYDVTTGAEIGYFNWTVLRDASNNIIAKPDSTGEFELIARKLRQLYGLSDSLICPFENVHDDVDPEGTRRETRENFFEALQAVEETDLDFFAYAGHGGTQSLPSAQVRARDRGRLVTEIRRLLKPNGIVLLYACSAGVIGGFASQLSASLLGMTVWAHSDAGQASRNADKIRFRNGSGLDIRDILSAGARERWARHLRASPDFYARFPFMTHHAIEEELA